MKTLITTGVDYEAEGKQHGFLHIPQSTNTSGWRTEYLPVTVLKNGDGPTAILSGGNHGDEYEGPVTLMNLARELEPDAIRGRIILLPMLNRPAVRSGTRLSPLDGKNLNREFPGEANGTITSMIAHYVSSVLFPMADYVVDIHSGGRTQRFLPSTNMHVVADEAQMQAMLAAGKAWGAPYVFIYRDVGGTGLLPGYAEGLGIVTLGTEIGSESQFGVEMVDICTRGVRNVLRHWGILDGEPEPPEDEPKLVGATGVEDYVMAPVSGIFEPRVELEDTIRKGDLLGRIHSIEQPHADPTPVSALSDGIVMGLRALPGVDQGDALVTIVRPFQLSF